MITIARALISVSDKEGIVELAAELHRSGVEIVSTGGTFSLLREKNIPVQQVSETTGFPEILDGRVKTMHPLIHGGILAVRDNPFHTKQLEDFKIRPFELVVVNLYPFEETIGRDNVTFEEIIENIDIGGPAMIRAAAKNHRFTSVLTNPAQYASFIKEFNQRNGAVSADTRFSLAKEAFVHTAYYDSVIAEYFLSRDEHPEKPLHFPSTLTMGIRKRLDLRYGENPHQAAAVYGNFSRCFRHLHGKELSYNNILDSDAAIQLIAEFSDPAVAIIKHTNPCGAGTAASLAEAYAKAFATDSKSAFGGIIAVNRPLDLRTAEMINECFTEVVLAPSYEPGVMDFFKQKKERRLLEYSPTAAMYPPFSFRQIAGGMLVQTPDTIIDQAVNPLSVVTERAPTEEEMQGLLFALKVAKHVKSNAIVYARQDRTLGIGAGQMSRVDSAMIAVKKAQSAGISLKGSSVASDAFFPFADGLLEAIDAGSTAVIQPGGSKRDDEVIKAANDHNVAMVFTGVRHFLH